MWKNLAPNLIRQRIIIEGTTKKIVEPEQIKDYLLKLAEVTKIVTPASHFPRRKPLNLQRNILTRLIVFGKK